MVVSTKSRSIVYSIRIIFLPINTTGSCEFGNPQGSAMMGGSTECLNIRVCRLADGNFT
jgi:hypothetical protein